MDLPMTDTNENVLVVTEDFQYYIPNLNQAQVRQVQHTPVSHHNSMNMGGHIPMPQSSQAQHLAPQNIHAPPAMGNIGGMRPVHMVPTGMDMGDGLQMLGNICMQTQQENMGVPRTMGIPRTVMQQTLPGQSCSYAQMSMNGGSMQQHPGNTMVTQAKDHGYSRNMMQPQRDNVNYQSSEAYKAALMIMTPDNMQDSMTTYQTVQLSNVNLNINATNTNILPQVNNPVNSFSATINTLNSVNALNTLPQPAVVTQTIDNCQLTELRAQFHTDYNTDPFQKELEEDKSPKKRKKMAVLRTGKEDDGKVNQVMLDNVTLQMPKIRKKGSGRKPKVKACHFCAKELVEPDKSVLFKIGEDGKSVFFDTCNACLARENSQIAAGRGEVQPEPIQHVPVPEIPAPPIVVPKVKTPENICQVCSKHVEKITSVIAKIEDGKVTYLNACKECSFKPKPVEEKKKKKLKDKKKKKLKKLKKLNEVEGGAAKVDEPVIEGGDVTEARPDESTSDEPKVVKTIGTQVDENPYKWKCSTCKKLFGSKNELQKHRRQNHRYYRLFQCDQCESKIKIYSSTEMVDCFNCGKHFDQTNYSPYTLSKQFYVKRTTQDLKCPICEKQFSSRRGVLEHQKIHTNIKPHLCNVCGKTFRTLPPLRIHMRVHTGEKPYQCEMCGKCFRQSSALNMHVRHHTGETPYSCEVCDKKFARRSQYTKHMESHTEKTFVCTVCSKKFPTEVRLKRHHRKHTDENPYRCTVCGMNYEENSAYRRHMQKHDVMNPYRCTLCGKQFGGRRGLMEHAVGHQEGNEFKCGICGEEYTNKEDLDTHIQSHFIEKPYKCQHCDLSFSTKSLLEHHTNFHSTREFFDCKKCGKKFTKRVTLDMHMRRHDGAKPFKCFICGEEYLWSTTLDSHMKTHYVNV
ncbi:zinc finger protein 595-like [Haliotis rufescens]|uniref:zinc finger protein 595-like n=1 Tax=Haliotis rufescens TaxID=6454 RepID=UPI001EAF9EAF|nr:zinc finger protein 595-like [Haliotis rufescens]